MTTPPHPASRPSRSLATRILVAVAAFAALTVGGAWLLYAGIDPREDAAAEARAEPQPGEVLASVRSWGYQLQKLDAAAAARSRHDLLVVDEQLDGAAEPQARAAMLRALKRKPDGSRRIVLAYLSIGEAEDYRVYWNRDWVAADAGPAAATPPPPDETAGMIAPAAPSRAAPALGRGASGVTQPAPSAEPPGRLPAAQRPLRRPTAAAPAWLGEENEEWRGNYRVRYWDPAWQALLTGSPAAALERIVAAGFDGIYLDRADVWTHWSGERAEARDDIVALIERLAAEAHRRAPGFLVVMQNAEELLNTRRVRQSLDGVAKEDLLYGVEAGGRQNDDGDVSSSLRLLRKARKEGLPVLVVEYLDDRAKIDEARRQLLAEGFVPTFAPRELDSLPDTD